MSSSRRTPASRRTRTRRRGAILLEFMMVLPMFLLLMVLTVDLGHLMFVYGATEDATYSAARAAAQAGGASTGQAQTRFNTSIASLPAINASASSLNLIDGECRIDPIIKVEGSVTIKTITPGLDALFTLVSGKSATTGLNGFTVKTQAIVLCEVTQ